MGEKRREPQRRRSKRPSARTANDDRQNWKHTKRREPAPTQNQTKRNAFHLLGRREKNRLDGKKQERKKKKSSADSSRRRSVPSCKRARSKLSLPYCCLLLSRDRTSFQFFRAPLPA